MSEKKIYKDFDLHEVSIVDIPPNPRSTITFVDLLAKARLRDGWTIDGDFKGRRGNIYSNIKDNTLKGVSIGGTIQSKPKKECEACKDREFSFAVHPDLHRPKAD